MLAWVLRPAAYVSLPFVLLCSVSTSKVLPTRVRYYLRATLYLGAMAALGVSAGFYGFAMNVINQRYNVNWLTARTFYFFASRAFGITVEVEGEEHLETLPAVFVSNHQSMVDILCPIGL